MKENKPSEPVVRESNNYSIVESYWTLSWFCPECRKQNYINYDSYVNKLGIDECVQCERAVNVMEPA